MVDFADLALRADYSQIDKATAALDRLKAAGAGAEQSTTRVGVSSIAQTRNMGAWAAIQAEAAGHVGEHSIAIGRLERALASYLGHAVGAGNATESLVAGLLKFSVGTLETVGVLAGLAAVVGLYELITSGARNAKKQMDDMTDSLVSQARASRAATLQGLADLKLIAEVNQQTVGKESGFGWRSAIMSAIAGRAMLDPTDAENQSGRRANAQTGVDQATKNYTDAWDKAEKERTRKLGEEARKREEIARKEQEGFLRYQQIYREVYGRFDQPQTLAQRAADNRERIAYENSPELSRYYGKTVLGPQILDQYRAQVGSFAMPNVSVNDGLTKEMVKQREKMGIFIEDANKNAQALKEAMFGAAMQSANIIVSALNIGGGGRGSGIGGALGQAGGAAVGYYFGGQVGADIGSVVGNIAGSLIGGLFDHGKAAREAAKAQRGIAMELEQIQARLAHNKLSETLLGIEAQLQATIASFNAGLPGRRNERQRNLDIAQAQALAGQQEQQARDEYARNQRYAGEDLAVRNLRALGRGDEAGLLAFKESQERELTQAIQDGRDATYQNNLLMTQHNELLAYQNGLLETAFRNAPTGFFANSYYSQFASPRGADPFNTGLPAPNSPSGTGAASGSGLKPPGSRGGTQTINVVLPNGKVLASVVVSEMDQYASATGGGGSSRSAALDKYPLS